MDKTVVKYVFITSLMFLACFEDCNCSSRHLSPATKGDLMSHLEHNNTKIAANTIAVISALLSGGTFEIFYVQKIFSIDLFAWCYQNKQCSMSFCNILRCSYVRSVSTWHITSCKCATNDVTSEIKTKKVDSRGWRLNTTKNGYLIGYETPNSSPPILSYLILH
jgi:hypothetical protein